MKLVILFILLPVIAWAHPGIGIVKDSKGHIYYTDLKQVWKIANGNKTIAVPNVHTHELHIDKNDNLYGEGGYYDAGKEKFYHFLWVYRPNGSIDTVVGMRQAYVQHDFSLARDKSGNEYYIKDILARPDTNHIYKKSPDGKETVFVTGDYKGVAWLHPQEDGSLFYVKNNAIFKIDRLGSTKLIKANIGNPKPSFKFPGIGITLFGVWQDNANNIYVAVFSDQTVKKIDPNGNMTDFYKSKGNWTPLHGIFTNDNALWVLESSDKNDVRVTMAATGLPITGKKNSNLPAYILISCLFFIILVYWWYKKHSGASPAGEQKLPLLPGASNNPNSDGRIFL